MDTIAIVDDRQEVRETAELRIRRGLKKAGVADSWRIVTASPLPSLDDYPGWLVEEDVAVLILDERLNESAAGPAGYEGHEIVQRIRPRLFDLPVYYLTAVPHDANVEADAPRVQAILEQSEFFANPEPWVKEFIREGVRYKEQVGRKLSRLSEIAESAALGGVTEEDLKEAGALRQELQLAFEPETSTPERISADRTELLEEFAQELEALESITDELLELLHQDPLRED